MSLKYNTRKKKYKYLFTEQGLVQTLGYFLCIDFILWESNYFIFYSGILCCFQIYRLDKSLGNIVFLLYLGFIEFVKLFWYQY